MTKKENDFVEVELVDICNEKHKKLKEALFSFGSQNRIDRTARFIAPENISFGCKCELRQQILFDARSREIPSIVIGNECRIKSFTSLMTYGGKIEVGNRVLIGQGTRIWGHNGISIGDDSMIGGGVSIQSVKHSLCDSEIPFQFQGFLRMPPIIISSNVGIGDNSVILPGVVIEANVVVGAGSVVTKSLGSGFIYVGNPARKKKRLPSHAPDEKTFYLEITKKKVLQGRKQLRNLGVDGAR